MTTYKVDGVSTLSNIEFSKEGIRIWRAYGVGTGRLISALISDVCGPVIRWPTVHGSALGAPQLVLPCRQKKGKYHMSK